LIYGGFDFPDRPSGLDAGQLLSDRRCNAMRSGYVFRLRPQTADLLIRLDAVDPRNKPAAHKPRHGERKHTPCNTQALRFRIEPQPKVNCKRAYDLNEYRAYDKERVLQEPERSPARRPKQK
jgi:hypothetical protein